MTCRKEVEISIDWVAVVREVKKHKDKPQGIIAIRLMEIESRLVRVK